MSWLSSAIDKVLPGAPSQNFTENTFDKWVAPEHKDTLELAAAMALGPQMLANLPSGIGELLSTPAGQNVAKGLSNYGATGDIHGAVLAGLSPILDNLPGPIGKLLKSKIGQMVLMSGNTDILGKLGFTGKQKDVVEQAMALMALAGIGGKYAKDAIEKAKALEKTELASIKDMVARADELYPTDEREAKQFSVMAEDISRQYSQSGKMLVRNLAQRGALRTGVGAGQIRRIGQEEAGEKLRAKRELELTRPDRVLAAQQAKAAVLAPLSASARYWRDIAEQKRMLPIDIALELYKANQPSMLDKYLDAQIAQMQGETTGTGLGLGELSQLGEQYGEPTLPDMGAPSMEQRYPVPDLDVFQPTPTPTVTPTLPDIGAPDIYDRNPVPDLYTSRSSAMPSAQGAGLDLSALANLGTMGKPMPSGMTGAGSGLSALASALANLGTMGKPMPSAQGAGSGLSALMAKSGMMGRRV